MFGIVQNFACQDRGEVLERARGGEVRARRKRFPNPRKMLVDGPIEGNRVDYLLECNVVCDVLAGVERFLGDEAFDVLREDRIRDAVAKRGDGLDEIPFAMREHDRERAKLPPFQSAIFCGSMSKSMSRGVICTVDMPSL
jgi:hypothetical protein